MSAEPGSTAPLPLDASRKPRTVLSFSQIITASEWMKSKAEEVRDMTDPTLAAHLTVVLGREVTTSNVTSLREGTGLHQREPRAAADERIRILASAVAFLLAACDVPPANRDALGEQYNAVQKLRADLG